MIDDITAYLVGWAWWIGVVALAWFGFILLVDRFKPWHSKFNAFATFYIMYVGGIATHTYIAIWCGGTSILMSDATAMWFSAFPALFVFILYWITDSAMKLPEEII